MATRGDRLLSRVRLILPTLSFDFLGRHRKQREYDAGSTRNPARNPLPQSRCRTTPLIGTPASALRRQNSEANTPKHDLTWKSPPSQSLTLIPGLRWKSVNRAPALGSTPAIGSDPTLFCWARLCRLALCHITKTNIAQFQWKLAYPVAWESDVLPDI